MNRKLSAFLSSAAAVLSVVICCSHVFAQMGNVGIGTTSPQAKLHTVGSVRHDTLAGWGRRPVYADSLGRLIATAPAVYSSTTPVTVPDNGCAVGNGAVSTITVGGQPLSVASSNIKVRVNVSAYIDEDLDAYLISPNGDTLQLISDNGGYGHEFLNTVFWDGAAAALPATSMGTPFTGVYKPTGGMAPECGITADVATFGAMGGGAINPNGMWMLLMFDDEVGDFPTLNHWSISFDGSDPQLQTSIGFADNVVPKSYDGSFINGSIYDVSGSIGIGTATPAAQLHVSDGNVLFSGPISSPSANSLPINGGGKRMIWHANRAAFRAGYVNYNQWDEDSIGYYSFATGADNVAKGDYSAAVGSANIARGNYTFAAGINNSVVASFSSAIGAGNTVSGEHAFAAGLNNHASGFFSTAIGHSSVAAGEVASTLGLADTATGNASMALGSGLKARSWGEVVTGIYNEDYTPANTTLIDASDRVFVVGNGTNNANRSNALTVLKNGNIGIGISIPTQKLAVAGTIAATAFSGSGSALTGVVNTTSVQTVGGKKTFSDTLVAAGNVGIGVAAPSQRLEVAGTVAATAFTGNGGALTGVVNTTSAQTVGGAKTFSANLIASGMVGIGASTPHAPLQFGNGVANRKIVLFEATDNDHQFYGFGVNGGYLRYQTDHTGADHVFYAAASATASNELMRIRGDGRMGLGTSTPAYLLDVVSDAPLGHVAGIQNTGSANDNDGLMIQTGRNDAVGGSYFISFRRPDGVQIGRIQQNGASDITYVTTSDRRLKESIQPTAKGLADLMKIQVSDYTYKSDPAKTLQTGFIAQDLYGIFPIAVARGDEKDESRTWGVDYGKLTPLLVKAVQEQQAEIEALRAENEKLRKSVNAFEELARRVASLESLTATGR